MRKAEDDALPTCLLVDDLEENLVALEALLRDEPARLLTARSAEEALELLLHNEVAVALVDVQMPGTDGIELAEMMRGIERTRHVPIVFVTAGRHDEARMFRGYDRGGAVGYLYKPLAPHVVRSKVRVFLELDRRRREEHARLAETERALADAEAARAAFAEANQLLERLLAIVGHDLRNPLNAIKLTAASLGRQALAPGQRELVARIDRGADRMWRLIDELLDYSRARQSGAPLRRERCDLADICQTAVAELQVAHPGRSVSLSTRGAPAGFWDRAALEQLVSNLVGNAIQHGEGTPVSVSVRGGGPEAVLEVTNSGEPIPLELLPHLFEAYRQGSRRSGSKSLGLGLYIVREIVRRHGGTVSVTSSRDAGTRFTVKLPVGQAPDEPERASAPAL
ncbi:MAG TPA: hybrid sensor histidine kinase/response regulator [Polyangiaceae bacterium]|nr:hybrid sensor histidine kinase/response regulator [Polyangiaceae bacterium]